MSTKFYDFKGQGLWIKGCAEPDDEYDVYSAMINLDQDSLQLFKESGLKNKFRDNDFGVYGVIFRRPKEKVFGDEIKQFGPPKVVDVHNNPIDPYTVGNGSEVILKVSVYDTTYKGKKLKGGRLEKVTVTNFIEYIRQEDNDAETPF